VGKRETDEVIYFDFSTSPDTVLIVHSQSKLETQYRDENTID